MVHIKVKSFAVLPRSGMSIEVTLKSSTKVGVVWVWLQLEIMPTFTLLFATLMITHKNEGAQKSLLAALMIQTCELKS